MEKENLLKNEYAKLDILAFVASLLVHIAILSGFHIKNAILKTNEFEVINFNAFSLDTEVESNLIALKSNPGKSTSLSSADMRVEIPSGMAVKKSSKGSSRNILIPEVKNSGEGKAIAVIRTGRKNSPSSKRTKSNSIGNAGYTLSISDSTGGNGKGSFSDLKVKGSPIAPYALKVKKIIMDNWKNPYEGTSKDLSVELAFTINRQGKMTSFNIEKLSTDSLFNDAAINAIYNSAPFPPIPENIPIKTLTLKVKFEVR
ncbi:energy transducer TonB [Desulfurobacterium sp.]